MSITISRWVIQFWKIHFKYPEKPSSFLDLRAYLCCRQKAIWSLAWTFQKDLDLLLFCAAPLFLHFIIARRLLTSFIHDFMFGSQNKRAQKGFNEETTTVLQKKKMLFVITRRYDFEILHTFCRKHLRWYKRHSQFASFWVQKKKKSYWKRFACAAIKRLKLPGRLAGQRDKDTGSEIDCESRVKLKWLFSKGVRLRIPFRP